MDPNSQVHILVVDDEEDICEILKFNLESEGYLVDPVTSGEDALGLLSQLRVVGNQNNGFALLAA